MNILVRKVIEWRVTKMLNKLRDLVDGRKVYILAIIGILNAVIGHFFGPLDQGPLQIPSITTADMWTQIWGCLVLAASKSAIAKTEPIAAQPVTPVIPKP